MGSFKPFVFGTAFGAGLAFLALQYHVIQSQDGFRVIPRTPQHSVGLAYADVRHWDAEQWADRPELVRALIADGATTIVTGGIADGVIESVSSDAGTLDQLREFLDDSPADRSSSGSLFDSPGLSIPPPGQSDTTPPDPFTVPFPDEARRQTLETAQRTAESASSRSNTAQKPSIRDVYSAAVEKLPAGNTAPQNDSTFGMNGNAPSINADDAQLLEEMLFGDDESAQQNINVDEDDDGGFGIFEDVTNALETRAEEVMNRARVGVQNEATRSMQDSVGSTKRYIREKARESLPESVSGMFTESLGDSTTQPNPDRNLPSSLKALRSGFDPFVD